MQIEFLGAAGTVTGSKFLVHANRSRVLIDCGLFQGFKSARLRNWSELPFEPAELDAIILTHAHIDHSGQLPIVVRDGFSGPIFCTPPTRALCEIMLADSGRLHEEDARYANKRGFSKHRPAKPLYTEKDAERVIPRMRTMRFGEERRVGEFTFHFSEAGHILGAAHLHLRSRKKSILFSGDIGRSHDPIMRPPTPPEPSDVVVMESTYGNRTHKDTDVVAALANVAKRTLERNGVLLIPSFAVGRAQTIMHCLEQVFRSGAAPRAPVYLDSPMATNASELYEKYGEYLKRPLQLGEATFLRTAEESKLLNFRDGPMVIISASGMLTGGRVLHHLRARAPRRENTILLPGFQAPGTRGARLVGGEPSVKVHGMQVPIEAEVTQLDAFSAHADQTELLDWIGAGDRKQEKVYLVHGEPDAAEELEKRIEQRIGVEAYVPQYLEVVDL